MKTLVTGGAGFVGSHLCERLLDDGHEVLCIDDLSTGRRENVEHLLVHPRFAFWKHDVIEPYFAPCERLYNLACPASPVHYQADPVRTLLVNVQGMLNALRCAHQAGARVLQASTSEVYGDPEVHPQPESYLGNVNPTGPRACYDEGKRCAETLCYDFARRGEADVRVVRIFNTYGPRMAVNDGRVVSNFIVQALRGEPLTVYGDGSQTRSFCYVSDLVNGIVSLMESDLSTPTNVGNPNEFTMRELAALTLELTGSASTITERPLPQDDPKLRRPDISFARERLDFAPTVELREGLSRTIDDFKTRLAKGSLR